MRAHALILWLVMAAAFSGYLVGAGALAVRQPWLLRVLRDATAQEAARLLEAPVAVGPLQGRPLRDLTVHGLAVERTERSPGGLLLRAERVRVVYRLGRLLLGHGTPVGRLEQLDIAGLRVEVERQANGTVGLPGRLASRKTHRPYGYETPRVALARASVRYVDRGRLAPDGRPLEVGVCRGEGAFELGRIMTTVRGGGGEVGDAWVRARVQVRSGGQDVRGVVEAKGAQALARAVEFGDAEAGDWLRAVTVAARYDLVKLIGGRARPVSGLLSLRVDRPRGRLSLDETGHLAAFGHVSRWRSSRVKPGATQYDLEITDGRVALRDPRIGPDGSAVLELRGLEGKLDMGRLDRALHGAKAEPAGAVRARATLHSAGVEAEAVLRTDATTRLELRELRAHEAGRRIAQADAMDLLYDLGAARSQGWQAGLKAVTADGLWARLALDARNRPMVMAALAVRKPLAATSPPLSAFSGRVLLTDADVAGSWMSRGRLGHPLTVRVVTPRVTLTPGGWQRASGSLGEGEGLLEMSVGRLRGAGEFALAGDQLRLNAVRVREGGAQVITARRIDLGLASTGTGGRRLREVALHGVRASLTLGRTGRVTLLDELSTGVRQRGVRGSGGGALPRISLREGDLVLADRRVRGRSLTWRARNAEGQLDLAVLDKVRRGGRASGLGQVRASLSGAGEGIRVGAGLRADLDGEAALSQVALNTGPGGDALRLARVAVAFAPGPMSRGDLAAGLRSVEIRDGHLRLVREATGGFGMARLLGGGGSAKAPRRGGGSLWGRLRTRVKVAGVSATLVDRSARPGPVVTTLAGLSGSASLGAPGRGELRATLRASGPSVRASAGLRSDLASWVRLEDPEIWSLASGRSERVLAARQVTVRYSLRELLGGGGLAAVTRLDLRAPQVWMVRSPDGSSSLQRLVATVAGPRAGSRRAGALAWDPLVTVRDGRVAYIDRQNAGGPVTVTAEALTGSVRPAALWGGAKAGAPWRRGGELTGQVAVDSPGLRGSGRIAWQPRGRLSAWALDVRERRGDAWVQAVDVARVTAGYDPAKLWGPRPVEALRQVWLVRPRLDLVRAADGKLEMGRLLETLAHSQAPARRGQPARPNPGVTVWGGQVKYLDLALTRGQGPLWADLRDVSLTLRAGQLQRLLRGLPAEGSRFAAQVEASWPEASFSGGVRTDLAQHVELRNSTLVARNGQGPRLAARSLEGRVALAALLRGEQPLLATLDRLRVVGLDAVLERDAQGVLDVAGLFASLRQGAPAATTRQPGGLEALHGRLWLTDSRFRFTDQGLNEYGPVVIGFEGGSGELDLARVRDLVEGLANRGPSGPPDAELDLRGLGHLRGQVLVQAPGGRVEGSLESANLTDGARLESLRVTDAEGLERGVARLVEASWDLAGAVSGRKQWVEALRRVTVDGGQVAAARDREGQLDVAQLWRGFGESGATAETRKGELLAQVRVTDSLVRFADRAALGGPLTVEVTGLEGNLDGARLARARRGQSVTGVGRFAGQVTASLPGETSTATVDWDLDRELKLSELRVAAPGAPEARLALDRGAARYDLAGLLGPSDGRVGAIQEIDLGHGRVTAWQGAGGRWTVARILEAYPSREKASAAAGDEFGGLRARVRAEGMDADLVGRTSSGSALRARVRQASGDVDLARLVALRAGQSVPSAGWVRAEADVRLAEARLSTRASVDLSGSATLQDVLLTDDNGARTVAQVASASVRFDPAQALRRDPTPAGLLEVALAGVRGEIVLDEGGRWELARLFPADEQPGSAAWTIEDFVPRVRLSDVTVTYRNRAERSIRAPQVVTATGLEGDVDLGAFWEARRTHEPVDAGELSGEVAATWPDAEATTRFSSDLVQSLELWDADFTGEVDGVRRRLVAASHAVLRGRLAEALVQGPALAQLASLELWDFQGDVTRRADGRLALPASLESTSSGESTPVRLAGRLILHGADVNYEDEGMAVEGGLRVGARELQGEVDLSALQAIADGKGEGSAGELCGRLAGRFGRYVVQGTIQVDAARRVEADDLMVREGFDGPVVVTARELSADYDLGGLLAGRGVWSQVSEIGAEGLVADLVREADGSLRLAQGLRMTRPADEGARDGFTGTVRLADSRVSLVDYATGRAAPLEVTASGLSGLLQVGALAAMREDGEYRDAGELRATVVARLGTMQAQATVEGRFSESLAATDVHLTAPDQGEVEMLSAPRLTAQYDLAPILHNPEQGWAAHLRHLALYGLEGHLTREADGRLRLERLLADALRSPASVAPEASPDSVLEQFAGRLSVEGSNLALTDLALLPGETAELSIRDAMVDLDLGALRNGETRSGPVGLVHADISLAAAGEEWSAVLGGALDDQVSLSSLVARTASSGQSLLTAGRVGVRLDMPLLMGEPLTAQRVASALREVELDTVAGTLRRDAAGRWASPALLAALDTGPRLDGPGGGAPGAVDLQVRARQVALRYVDESEAGGSGPLTVEIADAGGLASLAGDLSSGATDPLRVAGELRGQVKLTTAHSTLAGGFETDLFRSLRLTDVTSEGTDGVELARAAVAGVGYDLRGLIAGRRGLSVVRLVELREASAALSTALSGELLLAGIPVGVHLGGDVPGATATLGALSGNLTADEAGVMRGQLSAGGSQGLLGAARADVVYDPADDWLDIEGSAEGVRLAEVGRLLAPVDQVQVLAGTATLRGAAYGHLADARPDIAWTLAGTVEEGQARVARLGEAPVSFDGPLTATSEGVHTEGLALTWAGCEATVKGGLVNLTAPALALDVEARAARGNDLLGLLPEAKRARAGALLLSQPVTLTAQVAGPVRTATAQVDVRADGDVVLAAGAVGALRLADLDLGALVLDWSTDALRATAGVGAVTVERDGTVTGALAQLESGAVLPAARGAQVRLAQDATGAVQVRASAPWVRVRGVVGTGVELEGVVDGDRVQVGRVSGEVMGGTLRGAGVLDLARGQEARAHGRLELTGAQLGGLRGLDVWPAAAELEGTADVVAQGTVGGAGTDWGLLARAHDIAVGRATYESASLIAHGTDTGVTLDLAEVARGDGRLWARGVARRDPGVLTQGPLGGLVGSLHLAAADFDLSGFPGLAASSWAEGALYATASFSGALADPDGSVVANVFGLGAGAGADSVAALQLDRAGPDLRIAHLAAAAGRSAVVASDLRVEGFGLDWSRQGRLPRVDGRIEQGPVQGAGRVADVARVLGVKRATGGWAGLAGEIGGTLRRPRLGASVTLSNLQVGEWLVNQGDLEAELADDYLVVTRATARAGDTTAAFMGRVDDVYRGRNYNLVGSIRELSLEQLPPVQRLDAGVRGRADVTRIGLWGRKGESVAGSASVNVELTRLGTQSFRPFTGFVQFGSGLVRLEATRIRRAPAPGAREAAAGSIGLSALLHPAQRVVDAELRLSGPRGVTEAGALSPEQVRALPDVASTLALAAPVVQAIEMSTRPRDGAQEPARSGAVAGRQPLWRQLTSLSLRTAGRVVGRLRVGGPLDDLYCSGALRVWDARLDGRALPRDIQARADVAVQERRLENIALRAVDGVQELQLTGSADLPLPGETGAPRELALQASGKLIDVPVWRQWLPGAMVLGGSAGFEVAATGLTTSPTVRGKLEVRDPSGAGARFDRLTLPQVVVREGAIEVSGAELVRAGQTDGNGGTAPEQRVAVSGTLPWTWRKPWVPPDGPMDVAVTVRGPDLGFLPALLNDVAVASAGARRLEGPSVWASLRTGGAVDAEVAVRGTPRAPELSGHVTVEGGFVQGRSWETPVDQIRLSAKLDSDGGRTRLVADTARARWGNTLAEADGSWAYLDQLSKGQASDNEYHAEMRLQGPQAAEAGGAAARPMTVAGLRLGGLQGKVTVNTLSQALAGVPGAASTRVHRLNLEDVTVAMDVPAAPKAGVAAPAAAGAKAGALRANGWMELSDLHSARVALNRHDLTIRADNALVRYRDMLVGRLNGSLRATRSLAPGGFVPGKATGKVEGKLVLSNAEIGGKLPGGGRRGQSRALPASFASPSFDVRLALGPGVRLSGMGAYIPLVQEEVARFTGTLQAPLLQGRVTAVSGSGSGRVSLPAGAVDVRSGWVEYRLGVPPGSQAQERMPLALTGSLAAEGTTRISVPDGPGGTTRPYDVTLRLAGTLPDRITLEVDDVAGLTRDQILAHLGTAPLGGLSAAGQRVEDLISEQALSLLAAGLRTTLLAPLETEVMRKLGLTELTIQYGANQEFEVAVGKYVLRDLQISYRRTAGGPLGDRYTLSLSYRLKNKLLVSYTTNELSESHVRVSYVTEY